MENVYDLGWVILGLFLVSLVVAIVVAVHENSQMNREGRRLRQLNQPTLGRAYYFKGCREAEFIVNEIKKDRGIVFGCLTVFYPEGASITSASNEDAENIWISFFRPGRNEEETLCVGVDREVAGLDGWEFQLDRPAVFLPK